MRFVGLCKSERWKFYLCPGRLGIGNVSFSAVIQTTNQGSGTMATLHELSLWNIETIVLVVVMKSGECGFEKVYRYCLAFLAFVVV
jgi:hypothetical protein